MTENVIATRVGMRVKINHNPDIIYEVTRWDEQRQLWRAKCVAPSDTLSELEFREDFLAYLDSIERLDTRAPQNGGGE